MAAAAVVVLPQIAPMIALNLALITIATLNTFDLVLPLTGGGPGRATEVVSLFTCTAPPSSAWKPGGRRRSPR